jgi:phage FluMu protein Com
MHKAKLPIKDKYTTARGGYSRFWDVRCARCKAHLCYYQKDGRGMLKRLYADRIIGLPRRGVNMITCPKCKAWVAIAEKYTKENRPAYRLLMGAIAKRRIRARAIITP